MRKLALLLVSIGILILLVAFYPQVVERPVKDGPGPLSVYIDPKYPAPEFHSPLEWWQAHHKDVVNRGDFVQADCLYCHDPLTSCNNCHGYVGAAEIVE